MPTLGASSGQEVSQEQQAHCRTDRIGNHFRTSASGAGRQVRHARRHRCVSA
nr:MAG TPA: hypothetical protein [Caudoviricetes sp.]